MNALDFEFADIPLSIKSNEYLLDDFDNDMCRCLLVDYNGDLFTFGQPFFRSFNIALDYNSTMITIISQDKNDSSPIDGAWPSSSSNSVTYA